MAEIKLDPAKLVPIGVVALGALIAFGIWGRVSSLESRVVELNAAVEELTEVQEQIEEVTLEMARIRADVADVAGARDEILTELCAILERPPSACGVAA